MPRWWPVPLAVVALGAAALVAPVLVSTPAEAATPAGVNVARGATATQSSTEYGGVAARAVDGNTNGTFTGNSVSHTTSQSQAWLSVDLRQVQQLTDVVVWNRTDCCTTRLADFYVLASDNPITSTNLTTARAQTGVSSYHVSSLTSASTTVAVNRSARYLRVQLVGTNFLSLAEVQAFGSAALLKPDASGWVANNKFGMFLHFGMGTMVNAQWADPNTLASKFAPTGTVDTAQWAQGMKNAKMTFGVFTAKHHDGFAMWPTQQNDYSVKNSPWKSGAGDLVREYVDSQRAAGLKVGIYFSIWDRHNGDSAELIKNQLRELLTQYGTIDYLWFDGWGWQIPYTQIPYQSVRDLIANISPTTVVANNDHKSSLATTDVMVWEVPVQGFPPSNSVPKDASDTLDTNNTWFYTTSTGAPTAAATIVSDLKNVNAGNALYLLNVGPDKTGKLPATYMTRLTEIGALPH